MGILSDRVVLVTGSARAGGIGYALARRVAQHGGVPVVTSRDPARAAAAAAELRSQGLVAEALALDVASERSVEEAVPKILARLGRIDGVVHNAGAPLEEWARPFLAVPPEEYVRVFEVDVVGAARLTRALLPSMEEQGGGAFVFTSSATALRGLAALHEFAPAKAGVLGLMRSVAAEFGPRNIRANAVAYGIIRTPPTWDALDDARRGAAAKETALRRWGEPDEAADAACFLLSDLASFVTGQTLVVDGGSHMT